VLSPSFLKNLRLNIELSKYCLQIDHDHFIRNTYVFTLFLFTIILINEYNNNNNNHNNDHSHHQCRWRKIVLVFYQGQFDSIYFVLSHSFCLILFGLSTGYGLYNSYITNRPFGTFVFLEFLRHPSFFWGGDYVPRYSGHFWPVVQGPDERGGWLWSNWWNEDWQGKPKYSKKSCPSTILSITNPTWPDPGSNQGHRGGKPATNRLSYGVADRMGWYGLDRSGSG
jgi:hypothetical protein